MSLKGKDVIAAARVWLGRTLASTEGTILFPPRGTHSASKFFPMDVWKKIVVFFLWNIQSGISGSECMVADVFIRTNNTSDKKKNPKVSLEWFREQYSLTSSCFKIWFNICLVTSLNSSLILWMSIGKTHLMMSLHRKGNNF